VGRTLLAATVWFGSLAAALAQAPGTLHITVSLTGATGTSSPVARYALLISEEPPTAPPRRVLTTLAGTADVSLRPGRYAIESDQPVTFEGKTYEWSQRIDIAAGGKAILELTASNASIEAGSSGARGAAPSDTDPSFLAAQWRDTVVALWTPTRHASGFVVDPRGLIVTNQRVVGTATTVEAQLSPEVKVQAAVLASDPDRDVAILRVNPSVVASVRPMSLGCGQARPAVANGQELYALGADMAGQKRLTLGDVTGVGPRLLLSDLNVTRTGAGGPVFTAGGLIGFTTLDDRDSDERSDTRVVRIDQACELMGAAEEKLAGMPPAATQLPLDPQRPVDVNALGAAMKSRAGNLNPYPMSTADFDIAFITPVHVYAAKDAGPRPVMDFGNWTAYVGGYPRVLLVRATPKVVEALWAKVARGAAMTQGVSLPPIKRAKSGFARMRAFCGEAEVTPIHPFMVERRVSETEALYEGLYVFDPSALGAQCGKVTLTVYSEDDPDKGDTRVIDPKVLEQITRDFATLPA
jgi:hypothetical protein